MTHELVIKPSEIEHVSTQCKSCNARVLLPVKGKIANSVIKQCPHCGAKGEEWEHMHVAAIECCGVLRQLEKYDVAFHIPEPTAPKGPASIDPP